MGNLDLGRIHHSTGRSPVPANRAGHDMQSQTPATVEPADKPALQKRWSQEHSSFQYLTTCHDATRLCDLCSGKPSNSWKDDSCYQLVAGESESRTSPYQELPALTLSRFGITLASNVRYFRLGEHPGCIPTFHPKKFLCNQLPGPATGLAGQPRMNSPSPRRLNSDPK